LAGGSGTNLLARLEFRSPFLKNPGQQGRAFLPLSDGILKARIKACLPVKEQDFFSVYGELVPFAL